YRETLHVSRSIANSRRQGDRRSVCSHTTLFPHSGQNLVPASNLVPHLAHSFLGCRALPHSGQNFAPWVCAPHPGQSATASVVRSMPLVRFCCATFCLICSTVDCTCAAASSVSMSGAHS